MFERLPGILGIVATAAIIAMIDVPYMAKRKLTRELWTFSALLLLAATLGVALFWPLDLPTPLLLIEAAFKPFSDLLVRIGLLK